MQRFRQTLHQPCNCNLIAHLGLLSCACFADATADFGIDLHDRQRRVIGRSVTAAHNRECRVLRPCLSTGNGRIHEMQTCIGGCGVQFGRNLRRNRCVIDENRAFGHRAKRTICPQTDRAQVIVIAHARHYKFRALRGLCRCCRHRAAVGLHPGLSLSRCAVIDGHAVAGLLQMPRHGRAHDPQTQKCQFRHVPSPVYGCILLCCDPCIPPSSRAHRVNTRDPSRTARHCPQPTPRGQQRRGT